MKTHYTVKIMLVSVFLAAVMCLVAQPALAGGKSNNKGKNQTAVNSEQKGQKSQDEIDQILANGPPVEKGDSGFYFKEIPANGKVLVKEFENWHPINNSGWTPCPSTGCPYAQ